MVFYIVVGRFFVVFVILTLITGLIGAICSYAADDESMPWVAWIATIFIVAMISAGSYAIMGRDLFTGEERQAITVQQEIDTEHEEKGDTRYDT